MPIEKPKEEKPAPAPVVATPPKIVQAEKKPMIILQQPKKPQTFQIATSGATQQVFKVMPSSGVKVVPSGGVRPTFAGNVIKLMPGTILSGNKIIMKPGQSQQQIIVNRPATSATGQQIKINTVSTAQRIVMPPKPITIGGRTVTLQLAGPKKVTLVGNTPGAGQKIIMMPSGSIVTTATTSTVSAAPPKIEQLDGAVDDDFESQISTVKIEKAAADEGGEVKVTTSVESEAAAILSTIGEPRHLSSHSVNTVIPLHDEKALRNSLNESLLASPIITGGGNDDYGRQSLDALAAAALQVTSMKEDEGERWSLVGVFKNLTHNVTNYVDFRWDEEKLTSENLPELGALEKIPLEQGRAYRFRIAGVNACGVGKFSEVREIFSF